MICARLGNRGEAVKKLQLLLTKAGYTLDVDGVFGPQTESFIKAFQLRLGLFPSGVLENVLLHQLRPPTRLAEDSLMHLARDRGVDLNALRAFAQVESNGSGFLDDGRCKILYERHVAYRNLPASLQGCLKQHDLLFSPTPGGYTNQGEWGRLWRAFVLAPEATLKACSWGRFQVLGENAESLGWADVFCFVRDMMESEENHLKAFDLFCWRNNVWEPLKALDWEKVKLRYNGSGPNDYAARMAREYKRLESKG